MPKLTHKYVGIDFTRSHDFSIMLPSSYGHVPLSTHAISIEICPAYQNIPRHIS
jgi:hypothetical protein